MITCSTPALLLRGSSRPNPVRAKMKLMITILVRNMSRLLTRLICNVDDDVEGWGLYFRIFPVTPNRPPPPPNQLLLSSTTVSADQSLRSIEYIYDQQRRQTPCCGGGVYTLFIRPTSKEIYYNIRTNWQRQANVVDRTVTSSSFNRSDPLLHILYSYRRAASIHHEGGINLL